MKQQTNQITEGVIWKQLLLFFFPILFGTFFQQLYNTVDAVIVGNFVGKEALAAVGGPASTIINLLVGFFVGLSSGAGVIISQYFGSREKERLESAVHTSVALAVVGGAVMMVLGLLTTTISLRLLNTPEDIMPPSVTYMRIYFTGMIPSMVYNMGAAILRAIGDSKKPFYFLMAACLTNIVLDLLFVLGFGMGVTGVAIATVLSQVVSAILTMYVLMRTTDIYRVTLSKIRFQAQMLRSILTIGLPAGLQSAMYSISNLVIQAAINSYGTDTVAAWTAYGKVDSFFWMTVNAFGIAVTTFAGQNFGAGKVDRIKKSVRICLMMAAGTCVFFSFVILTFGHIILRLFTQDPVVIEICMGMIRIVTPTYITYICIEILSGACRGCGDSFYPMIITCFGVCALRIIWIALSSALFPSVGAVCLSYPITWTVTSTLFILYYRRGKWLRHAGTRMVYMQE
ncbi:MAG: MATE family efflux transporter [Eubacteriales bacterium]|nr:MATE family efflux transporter [Eubacteriales bacterium]